MNTRISGGRERGRRIRTRDKEGLRPTSERVRSALFSIISQSITGARVLDLYAGTGILGFEALSRGADSVHFVESSAPRCAEIRSSLLDFKLEDRAVVTRGRVEQVAKSLKGEYDIVMADPPYDSDPWQVVMEQLDDRGVISKLGIIVAEHSRHLTLSDEFGNLVRWEERRYGDTVLTLYKAE